VILKVLVDEELRPTTSRSRQLRTHVPDFSAWMASLPEPLMPSLDAATVIAAEPRKRRRSISVDISLPRLICGEWPA
jgi:hypothetical protein